MLCLDGLGGYVKITNRNSVSIEKSHPYGVAFFKALRASAFRATTEGRLEFWFVLCKQSLSFFLPGKSLSIFFLLRQIINSSEQENTIFS